MANLWFVTPTPSHSPLGTILDSLSVNFPPLSSLIPSLISYTHECVHADQHYCTTYIYIYIDIVSCLLFHPPVPFSVAPSSSANAELISRELTLPLIPPSRPRPSLSLFYSSSCSVPNLYFHRSSIHPTRSLTRSVSLRRRQNPKTEMSTRMPLLLVAFSAIPHSLS